MVKKTKGRQDVKGIRDNAILSLMYSLALRRSELINTDLVHLSLGDGDEPSTISIIGKGKTQRTKLSIPEPTVEGFEDMAGEERAGGWTSLLQSRQRWELQRKTHRKRSVPNHKETWEDRLVWRPVPTESDILR